MSNKGLVVTGPFVPTNEPMTLLPYKHLRLLDFEYDVVALKETVDKSLELKLKKDINFKKFNVEYVGNYQDVLFSIKNVNLIKALLCMKKYINDATIKFKQENYDMIYTSAFPAYTHRVGLEAKRIKPSVQWIANFTDPINHSPYKHDAETYKSYGVLEKIAFHAYSHFYVNDNDERIAFENADILVFICEEQRDFMIEQYCKYFGTLSKESLIDKSVIVPLNYVDEWEDIQEAKHTPNEILRLSHFGRVYGLRKIDKFIYALKELLEENPQYAGKFLIEQYGEFKKKDVTLIRNLHLDNLFEINPKIAYEDCLKRMQKSDILLIFDTIMDEESWQPYLPSKVIEYSILQKDVFALTTSKSPTYRIMKKTDGLCASYDVRDIKTKLKLALDGHASKIEYRSENKEAISDLKSKLRK